MVWQRFISLLICLAVGLAGSQPSWGWQAKAGRTRWVLIKINYFPVSGCSVWFKYHPVLCCTGIIRGFVFFLLKPRKGTNMLKHVSGVHRPATRKKRSGSPTCGSRRMAHRNPRLYLLAPPSAYRSERTKTEWVTASLDHTHFTFADKLNTCYDT